MKNRFVKFACLFAVLALVLSGCSLIKIDPVMQADEDMEALQKELSTVIVSYDGGEVTKGDMLADFNNEYSYLAYMYSTYGYTLDASQADGIVENVAKAHMNTRASLLKAEEMGIELTEDEIAECEAAAKESYDSAYINALASAEGDSAELREKNAQYSMMQQGLSEEIYLDQNKWTKIVDKVEEAVKAEVEMPSDEELEMLLTEHTMDDQHTYENDLVTFEMDMSDASKCITWRPEGYRTAKHILLKPEDELTTAFAEANSAVKTTEDELHTLRTELNTLGQEEDKEYRTEEEVNADIDEKNGLLEEQKAARDEAAAACIANVQDRLDEVYAKLEAGDEFDAVMAEFGEDPGMQNEPSMTRGYFVAAESEAWDTNFRDAVMALENVGDYSMEPVVSTAGVHIVYYNSDVTPGQVSLDEVHDEFAQVALEQAQEDHITALLNEWVAALNPEYHTDRFLNVD